MILASFHFQLPNMTSNTRDRIRVVIFCGALSAGIAVYLHGGTTSESVPANSVLMEAGQAGIYSANCATCHGRDGRAKTAKGKRLGATDFTSDWNTDEARGIRIITNGRSEMPSFKKKLSAAEIRSVFAYVRRFRR